MLALAAAVASPCWALAAESAARPPAVIQRVPTSRAEIELTFAPVVKRAVPAVVNVYAMQRDSRPGSTLLSDSRLQRFFGGLDEPNAMHGAGSLGSGVIIAPDGVVVTNNHVIEHADDIRVALSDRREFDCKVLLKDRRSDLAVLKIVDPKGERFPFLPFGNSDTLEVGDLVLAIGNPFGVGQTVTQGIVSALARTEVGAADYRFFIQTDAAINPGNSGGALIDLRGRLVGINSAIFSAGGGSNGIGFAIPADMVKLVTRAAMTDGVVHRPWLGVRLQAVTSDIADGLGLDRPEGALVTQVLKGSPADKAGLSVGDLIMTLDGKTVADPDAFGFRIAMDPLGSTAMLGIMRDGKAHVLDVALAAAPETPPRDTRVLSGSSPFAGLTVMNLSPAVADELAVDSSETGVVVSDVADSSVAARLGFQRGDRVTRVNGVAVATSGALDAVAHGRPGGWQISIDRGGRRLDLSLGG